MIKIKFYSPRYFMFTKDLVGFDFMNLLFDFDIKQLS